MNDWWRIRGSKDGQWPLSKDLSRVTDASTSTTSSFLLSFYQSVEVRLPDDHREPISTHVPQYPGVE